MNDCVQQEGVVLASDDHLQEADAGEDLATSPEAKAKTHGGCRMKWSIWSQRVQNLL